MKKLLAILTVGLVCGLGAQAATINVPADQPTIQAAIDASASGDIINIANGTYSEDLVILNNLLVNKSGITLQGSSAANVIIDAPNTKQANVPAGACGIIGLLSGGFGAGALPTHKGIHLEGHNVTLRNLTIRNLSTTGDPLFGESAAIMLMGDNCTIEDCIIECHPGNAVGRGIYVITGDWAATNPAFGALYPSPGFSAANLTVTNTVFVHGDGQIDSVDAAFYLWANGFTPGQPPVRVGSGSFTNCEFTGNGQQAGEMDGGTYTYTDCDINGFNQGMIFGGGTSTFVNCTFSRSKGGHCARQDWTGEGGPTPGAFIFIDTIFCGNAGGDGMLRIADGTAQVSGCIFNATNTNNNPVVRYSPGDISGNWALFGGFPGATSITIDQSDIYNPAGRGIRGDDPQTAGEPVGNLTVTNSIFTCLQPFQLVGAAGAAARNATVTNNNLYTTGTVDNPDSGWVVTEANNLNVDPQYNVPGFCPSTSNRSAFEYNNALLSTAGTGGGPIGSQAPQGPPAASVEKWEVYE